MVKAKLKEKKEEVPKQTAKAKKVEASALAKASKIQGFINKGICTACKKTKSCVLYKNHGPARQGERCMDFQEK